MPTGTGRPPSEQGQHGSGAGVHAGARAGLHYGWIVLAMSTLTVMGCLGFARFGYTLILPSMQDALTLTNT